MVMFVQDIFPQRHLFLILPHDALDTLSLES